MLPRPYEGDEAYIFISYSHRNQEQVYQVLEALQEKAYRFWYDDGIAPGIEWPEDIARHLNNAGAVISFITPESVASANCRREINFALAKEKPFLSVMLEPTELPLGLELQLGSQRSIQRSRYPDWDFFLEKILSCPALAACKGKETALATSPAREDDGVNAETDDMLFARLRDCLKDESNPLAQRRAVIAELEKLAEREYPLAMTLLAWRYRVGEEVEKDLVKARYWLERGAVAQNALAQLYLGEDMINEREGVRGNVPLGLFWLERAAENGESRACHFLGLVYRENKKVPRDGKKAIYWFEKGAARGNVNCQCEAGRMYLEGTDIPKNLELSYRWLSKAAQQGSSFGQYYMGEFYRVGCVVEKDLNKAKHWFSLSAEQGDRDAAERLRGLLEIASAQGLN